MTKPDRLDMLDVSSFEHENWTRIMGEIASELDVHLRTRFPELAFQGLAHCICLSMLQKPGKSHTHVSLDTTGETPEIESITFDVDGFRRDLAAFADEVCSTHGDDLLEFLGVTIKEGGSYGSP